RELRVGGRSQSCPARTARPRSPGLIDLSPFRQPTSRPLLKLRYFRFGSRADPEPYASADSSNWPTIGTVKHDEIAAWLLANDLLREAFGICFVIPAME